MQDQHPYTLNLKPKPMNRSYLNNTIKALTEAKGYNFHHSESQHFAEQIKGYPTIVLEPPKFIEMEGRRHGKISYSIRLHAMEEGAKLTADARNVAYARLEADLIEMLLQLSKEKLIICVESLQISCSNAQLTPHCEVAATATAKIITMF